MKLCIALFSFLLILVLVVISVQVVTTPSPVHPASNQSYDATIAPSLPSEGLKSDVPDNLPPIEPIATLSKQEAKAKAQETYNRLRELENNLLYVNRTGDIEDYRASVFAPLMKILGEWPRSSEPGNEAIEPYTPCFLAANALSNIGDALRHEETYDARRHEVQEWSQEYDQAIGECNKAIGRN